MLMKSLVYKSPINNEVTRTGVCSQEALDRELYGAKREPQRQRAKPRQRKPRVPKGSGVTKQLVVKLTPVPLETLVSPDTNAHTCSTGTITADMAEVKTQMEQEEEKQEKTERLEGRTEGKEGKEEVNVEEKCEEKDDDDGDEGNELVMDEENSNDEDEGNELEMAEENKRSPRVKTTPRRRRSDTTHAGLQEDSDSDEVPAVLLQTTAGTSEEEGGVDSDGGSADTNQEVRKKCLFGLVKNTPPCEDRASRKRKLKERSSSLSSSSSNAEVVDPASKVRRAVGSPNAAMTTMDSESSSSEQETDSSDSDELDQKIKPLSDVTLMGSGTFQQSSGTVIMRTHITFMSMWSIETVVQDFVHFFVFLTLSPFPFLSLSFSRMCVGDEVDECPTPLVLDEDDVENRYGLDSECAGQSSPSQTEALNSTKPPDTHTASTDGIQTRFKGSHTSGSPLTPTRTRRTRAAASTGLVLRRLNM